jgi:hypothetical protein
MWKGEAGDDWSMATTHLDVLVENDPQIGKNEIARTNSLTMGSCIAGCSLSSLMFGLALTGFLQLGDWGWPAPLVPPINSDGLHGWVVLALLLYICYHMSPLRKHKLISFVGEGAQGCWSKMVPQLAEGSDKVGATATWTTEKLWWPLPNVGCKLQSTMGILEI